MLILSIFSTITVLVGAADYSLPASSAPAKYVREKPAAIPVVKASDIALIAKLVEQLQGYGHSLPGPVYIGDGMLTDQSYSETDLSPLLKLLYRGKPKKHGVTATVKYLNPLPGLYGDPSYGIANSHLTAAYKRPALGLGLLHALASPANLLYPHPSPAYVHYGPGPRLPLGPAGIFGYSGYASSPASLAPVPVIIITKKHVDEEEYEGDLAAITESPNPAAADYVLKPKKNVIKVVAPAKKAPASTSYGPGKTKVLSKQTKAKVYSKTTKVKPVVVVNKAKNYKKVVKVTVPAESTKTSYSPMTIKATKAYSTTEKPIAAVEINAPVAVVPVAPKYTGVPTVAPAPVATKYTAVPTVAPASAAPKYTAVPAVAPAPDAPKSAAVPVVASAPVAPKYTAVAAVASAPVAPKYTAVPTVAPAAPAPVAVAKPANDAPSSPDSAETADAASISEPDAGESARASLPETKISSQQTISRIS